MGLTKIVLMKKLSVLISNSYLPEKLGFFSILLLSQWTDLNINQQIIFQSFTDQMLHTSKCLDDKVVEYMLHVWICLNAFIVSLFHTSLCGHSYIFCFRL